VAGTIGSRRAGTKLKTGGKYTFLETNSDSFQPAGTRFGNTRPSFGKTGFRFDGSGGKWLVEFSANE
jgi:hypothetical protein